jgi:hypothetical protein
MKTYTVSSIAAAHSFHRWDTGGGCTALHREWSKHYALITAVDDAEMPATADEPCALGFYFNEQDHSEPCVQFDCASLAEALAIADKLNGSCGFTGSL